MPYACHLILGMYGFWLPNDPRGSGSRYVGSRALWELGGATRVETRQSVAHRPHDRYQRLAAKEKLKYPPVSLVGLQARAVALGMGSYARRRGLAVWACAILPDHAHLVLARPHIEMRLLANQFKGAATRQLVTESIHPLANFTAPGKTPPKVFARGQWCVYLDTSEEVRRTIRYVELNPVKEGLPRQRWSFVEPFIA